MVEVHSVLPFSTQQGHLSKQNVLNCYPLDWIYLLAVDDDHMITSVIEGVVNWLIFPHQIFCHDLMLSDSNQ